jgi:DNA-binding NtrC family response regulator
MSVKHRILFVDDEPFVLSALSRLLRRDYDVVTAPGGGEGLAAIRQGPPFAAVVSDLRMPEMDGMTFLEEVRQLAPDTARILLSGLSDEAGAVEAVREGRIFQILMKPASREELLQALSAAVEGRGQNGTGRE